MNNPQQPQMNVDFSQTTAEVCEKCENDTFSQVYQMRKLSALLSPTGEKAMIPVQIFACAKCGHINPGFLPVEKAPMKKK
tara:strand:- start:67 stop:306 length:240 start_codon:yes stop_codon:yes gene_type:complete